MKCSLITEDIERTVYLTKDTITVLIYALCFIVLCHSFIPILSVLMFIYVSIAVCKSIHLSVSLSVHLFLFIFLSVYLIYPFIYVCLSVHVQFMCTNLSLSLSIDLSHCICIFFSFIAIPFRGMSACLSIQLSLYFSLEFPFKSLDFDFFPHHCSV